MKKSCCTHFMIRVLAVFGILMFALAGMATTEMSGGDIKGVVFDKEHKEPLVGARVSIIGTGLGAFTDIDGVFVLKNVPEGPITLEVSYISFETQRVENLDIKKGEVRTIEIQLVSDDEVLEEVVVIAKANRASEIQLLKDQRTLVVATQAIGANELSRKGIGDAEAAVAQVSGVSKQEGVKNVFIRGLSDRYNATYLNGFPIPSDDPEYKNIALDMFDTDMIQSVGVQKAFSATQGGDVGGAIIDIKSQELFGEKMLEVGASVGANTSVLGNTFYKQDGTSYFGGTRSKMPEAGSFGNYPFVNKLQPLVLKSPINHGFNIAMGRKTILGGGRFPLSLYLVANHSKGYSHSERISKTLNPNGSFNKNLAGPNSSISTRQMVLGNATLGIDYDHELRYNLLMIHSNNEYSAQLFGDDTTYETDGLIKFYRQQANENLLLVNQLDSDWKLSDGLLLNVGVAYNKMNAKEPDRRIFELNSEILGDGDIKWESGASDANDRFYSTLKEDDVNLKASANWVLSDPISLNVGYKGRYVNHNFDAVEFNHSMTYGASILESEFDKMNWDEIFYNSNLMSDQRGIGFQLTKGSNYWYSSKKFINTGFLEVLWNITPKFMLQAGLRMDHVNMTVDYGVDDQLRSESAIKKMYWLPSLNLKYEINEDHTLRMSASKSYALPQVKEISPYKYINIGYVSFGDPNIKPSDVWNLDLKWDWYLSPRELFSATIFYKNIKNPIARVDQYISSGGQEYTNLASKVNVAGFELELRKNLFQIQSTNDVYHKLDLGVSGSYIFSDLYLNSDPDRARHTTLEGASPWIANSDLTYSINANEKNYSLAVLCSYFSDRIQTYGSAGIVNKGMYHDIIEKGMVNLHLVAAADITKNFSMKLKANNLLNQPFRLTQIHNPSTGNSNEPVVISEYKKGVSFSLSAKYTF